jgi:hypothetical protein
MESSDVSNHNFHLRNAMLVHLNNFEAEVLELKFLMQLREIAF